MGDEAGGIGIELDAEDEVRRRQRGLEDDVQRVLEVNAGEAGAVSVGDNYRRL